MLAVPMGTWFWIAGTAPSLGPASLPMAAGSLPASHGLEALRDTLRPALPWASALWILGVAFMSLRLLGGWAWMQRLRWRLAEPAPAAWQQRVARLCGQLGVRGSVLMLKSLAVDAPMVIGWLKPVILVPAAALAGMAPQALETILAHELEHIRRHDYLVNLLQSMVEALLFYHPAVWWLSRQIRLERENCCDDAAVSLCGDPVLYARALAGLEDLRQTHPLNPNLALAANGGSLMNRIQRLILPKLPPSSAGRAGLLAVLAVSALGAATTMTLRDDAPKQPQVTPAPKVEAPAPQRKVIQRHVVLEQGDLEAKARKLEVLAEELAKKHLAASKSAKPDADLARLEKDLNAMAKEIAAEARKMAQREVRRVRIPRIEIDGKDLELPELAEMDEPGQPMRVEKRIIIKDGKQVEETTSTPEAGNKRVIIRHLAPKPNQELAELKAEIRRLNERLDKLAPLAPMPPPPPAKP
jgi:beta-lactamase regulating signal transducer with metallopeptidase domain